MPQSERNRRITFRWEEVVQAVPRMANLIKEFLLEIESLQSIALCSGQIVVQYHAAVFNDCAYDRFIEAKQIFLLESRTL